jgi:hypothetical protein
VTFVDMGSQGLNDRGEVTFLAMFDDGREEVFRASPPSVMPGP